MRVEYDPGLKANLSLDDAGRVRSVNHTDEYWESDGDSALQVAVDYLRQVSDILQVPTAQMQDIQQQVSYLDPMEQGAEYRLSEQKPMFDATTVGFYQTYLNVPVWQAGLTVTVKSGPYRVVAAVNTSQDGIDASLPSRDVIERYRKLFPQAELDNQRRRLGLADEAAQSDTAAFVHGLIHRAGQKRAAANEVDDRARLIQGRFFVYEYDAENRLPHQSKPQEPTRGPNLDNVAGAIVSEDEPVLPLPPVPDAIKDGRYYMVAEVTFTYATARYGLLNWLALVELETGAVLYLRALSSGVNGMVFVYDPITATGNAGHGPDQTNAVLNPDRTSVFLPNLNAPSGGVQALRGSRANVTNVEDPTTAAPTRPTGSDFNYDTRTDEFAAVSAYYHADRFFALVESLGFTLSTYFSHTAFPVPVDHRGLGNIINAHCVGNGTGGIGHLCYALAHTGDTTHPIGIAADWRVHLHELGGHGVLYEHVNSANFGFSHSAGDSLAVIMNDPESHAPDRFLLTPWVPAIARRHDRTPAAGWAWGGVNDVGSYSSEQILATTLFRIYRSIGGDSTDLARRQFAARMTVYLVLRAIGSLTPATNPATALAFANALLAVDPLNWTSEGVYGGAYGKLIRWSFEKQGLYQAVGAPTPVTTVGQPPQFDVYIDDGRAGEYPFLPVHWQTTTIWNRRDADGLTGHQEAALGVSNYAYVKIKNRGIQTATNVRVRGYHCKPGAGVVWPNDFQSFTTPELPAGTLLGNNAQEKIVGPFEWTPIVNAYGHDCMLLIVRCDGDPSNVDNFTIGELAEDWRLVPNDNNVAQRNVVVVPGGGGLRGLLAGLHGFSLWVHNPNRRTSTMEVRAHLPELLASGGWRLTLRGIDKNKFELKSGREREVVIELHPGAEFTKEQVESAADRDIDLTVYANDTLIGGMTYRLDPDIRQPYNVAQAPDCAERAQALLDCLQIKGQKVKKVCVKKVTLDVTLGNDCDCC